MQETKLSLDVLEIVKTAQNQNGLRHSDYARYRAYCTRKLRRLREGKRIRLLHGTGKKWRPLSDILTAETVKESRHLQLLLFQAERAWAYSMELKCLVENSESVFHRARRASRALSRMRRALFWAESLKTICSTTVDSRSQLEVDAYTACMQGTLFLERRQWADTLAAYATATQVYEELARVSVGRVRDMYTARLEDIAPIVRLAKYNMGRGGRSKATVVAGAPQSSELALKIQAAAAESESAQADGFNSVCWRGAILSVRSEKLRGVLSAVGEVLGGAGEVAGANAGVSSFAPPPITSPVDDQRAEALYIEVLTRLDEGVRVGEMEAVRAGKEGKEVLEQDLKGIGAYLRFIKHRTTMERLIRNVRLSMAGLEVAVRGEGSTETAAATAPSQPWGKSPIHTAMEGNLAVAGGGALSTRASIAARNTANLFSRILALLDEVVGTLSPGTSDAPLLAALAARRALLAAHKAWYVSLACLYVSRYSEALGMMGRAEARVQKAQGVYASLASTLGLTSEGFPTFQKSPGVLAEVSPGASSVLYLSGVWEGDVMALSDLMRAIALRRVQIEAGGLLESLAPAARSDAHLHPLYRALQATQTKQHARWLPRSLIKSSFRRGFLIERGACGAGGFWPGAGSLSTTEDSVACTPVSPSSRSTQVPVLGVVPVPFKPILFDLAFSGIEYPLAKFSAQVKGGAAAAAPRSSGTQEGVSSPSKQPDQGGAGILGWFGVK